MALSAAESIRTSITATGTFHTAPTGLTGTVDGALSINRSTSWTFGASGADTVNQPITMIFTATKNTRTRLDLSGALTNCCGESSGTLTKIKWMLIELLTTAQDSTNGNAFADTVKIYPSVTAPITTLPLGGAIALPTFTGDTHTSTTIDAITSTVGLQVGMPVSGTGIPAGAYIAAIPDGVSITLSAAATASATGVTITPSYYQYWLMNPGNQLLIVSHDTTGFGVTATTADGLDFVIAANNLDAKFRISILGNS